MAVLVKLEDFVARALYLVTVALICFGLLWAKRELRYAEAHFLAGSQVSVAVLAGEPEMDQDSIDLAMAAYSIRISSMTNWPVFDRNFSDRGLTARGTLSGRSSVSVGPAAFSSWALLGSTLAHEIEVHGEQNFLIIGLMDLMRLDGTGIAERQAYSHEIEGATRFGLCLDDQDMIAETKEFFYPEAGQSVSQNALGAKVKGWLSKNILRERIVQ